MSSLNDLYDKVQMLREAKVSPVGKQAPVFKNVPKQMKAAGMAASSRDAMIFITQVLSRLDIISPEVYEMTVKGQHRERMEKLMTILRAKEEEINAKSDEIVEYINQNLDNYTAGAGSDRNRAEKYKETAKDISQEVQNIKAGKEADDALRDIATTVAKGLDSDVTDEDIAALDFDEADIFINLPDAETKANVAQQAADYLNKQGLKAEVTRAGVNIEAPTGFFGDNAKMAQFEDKLKGLVMDIDGNIPENQIQVKFTGSDGPIEVEDGEHAEDYEMVEDGEHEDAEGKYDDHDGEEERCDYVPCEDGEGYDLDDEAERMLSAAEDILGNLSDQGFDDLAENGMDGADEEHPEAEGDLYNLQDMGWKRGGTAWNLSRDIVRGGYNAIRRIRGEDNEEVVAESKYSTSDNLLDIYATVKPIVETIVESTTVNENGQTSHTQQYIVEKAEAAVEQHYTNQYLTEQKASDSLLVTKEENSVSFKERYQPKTSYQLEELRRYGL